MHNNRKLSQYMKLGIIIVMIIVFSCYPTFAAEECSWITKDSFEYLNVFFSNLWRFFSWIWIVLWNFAGVLMTNSMVYWEFMHLDSFLWKIWQMSRTIANYALWFLFIYYIFRYIFFKDEKPPVTKIKDILVASVLVQVSWFMTMVLVDLSTIALATVSSFPSQIMSVDSKLTETFKSEIGKSEILNDKKIIVVNAFTDEYLQSDNSSWFSIEKTEGGDWSVDPKKSTIDALLPGPDNLWGPFIYLWATAFQAQKFVVRPIPVSANCVDSIAKVLTNLLLDAWTVILYSLALSFLIVLLVMRLGYLRIFIAISPIVVLVYALKLTKLQNKNELFDLRKVIVLIFKPAIFALWISLMFIVVVTVQRLFDQSMNSYLDSVGISDKQQTSTKQDVIPKVSSSLEDAWIVGVYLKNWAKSLKDVILSLITLVLMWQLVKLALTSSIWGVGEKSKITEKMKSLVKNTWTLFWSVWVVPTPKGMMWFNEIWDFNGGTSPLLTEAREKIETSFTERDKSEETILALLWKWDKVAVKSVTQTQKDNCFRGTLGSDAAPSAFVKWLSDLREKNKWALKFQDVKKEVETWVKNRRELKSGDTYYSAMANYFKWEGPWEKLKEYSGHDDFDIGKWFKDNDEAFKSFYTNVLKGNEKYDTYKDFIDKWGIIRTKKTTSWNK